MWEKGPRKKLLAGELLKRKEIHQWGSIKTCKIVHCFLFHFLFNSTRVSDMRTKQRGQRLEEKKAWSQKIVGYQYHFMELEFCCGGDIITEGFKEEERHKDLCFKKTEWVASLHYKAHFMFISHTHMPVFFCACVLCGYLYVYAIQKLLY